MSENPIYLRIDTTNSSEKQLIHLEGIGTKQLAISNVAILAEFDCTEINNKLKVNRIDFEMYELPGLLQFKLKEVDVKEKPIIENGEEKRVIAIKLSLDGGPKCSWVNPNDNEIFWDKDAIIDNKISFELPIFGEVSREDLVEKLQEIGIVDSSETPILVPVQGRPCQFKLVQKLS